MYGILYSRLQLNSSVKVKNIDFPPTLPDRGKAAPTLLSTDNMRQILRLIFAIRYRSLQAILAQLKKLQFAANTTIELNNITNTPNNTSTLLSQNTPRCVPLLSNVVVIFLRTIAVLTPNWQFLDCASIAVSERIMFRVYMDHPCVSLHYLLTFSESVF